MPVNLSPTPRPSEAPSPRGVARVYGMSLENRVWKVWRDAPGFSQRYTGVISDDGSTIKGSWERSADARTGEHDFGLTYTKLD
jgi:hypothetical protein